MSAPVFGPLSPELQYVRYGFAVVRLFEAAEVEQLERFAEEWISKCISEQIKRRVERPLHSYHLWHEDEGILHATLCTAVNRHTIPPADVAAVLLNRRVWNFLSLVWSGRFRIWDEGLGWLGFRLIRPGSGDGYPPSRKEWGPAKRVISCWIPIIGRSSAETLALVPGSHLREYEKYMPSDDKFRKDEFRLVNPKGDEFVRPNLEIGDAIFYHPRLIHSEDVYESEVTRLSLEMRFDPI